jgi:hypothetical protein
MIEIRIDRATGKPLIPISELDNETLDAFIFAFLRAGKAILDERSKSQCPDAESPAADRGHSYSAGSGVPSADKS